MRVAVLGATGSVGRAIVGLLHERQFPCETVVALASPLSVGRKISMGDADLTVASAETFDFSGTDLVFSAVSAGLAKRYIPRALKAGCRVIDKSSAFRMEASVPLVIPEVNGHLLDTDPHLIASPNCVVIPLLTALAPLCEWAQLVRLGVSTYQSVSGAGKAGMDVLYDQMRTLLMAGSPRPSLFSHPIAFNVIPQIGDLDDTGWSDEERKIQQETHKLLKSVGPLYENSPPSISVTSVRVPVLIGHSASVVAEFEEDFPLKKARSLWGQAPGVRLCTSPLTDITPLESVGEDEVFVSRVRGIHGSSRGVCFWMVCDNLRKGASLNAVQIAENLVARERRPG